MRRKFVVGNGKMYTTAALAWTAALSAAQDCIPTSFWPFSGPGSLNQKPKGNPNANPHDNHRSDRAASPPAATAIR